MSNNQELIQRLNDTLQNLPPKVRKASGRFLYSNGATMKKGCYYLIGKFPSGTPKCYPSLDIERTNWEKRTENAYLDEAWEKKGGHYPKGKSPYQIGAQNLCRIFNNIDVREICASNWIMTRSPMKLEQKDLRDMKYLAEIFAPVHEIIMEIVQPKIVFAIGIETFKIALKYLEFVCPKPIGEEGNWRVYIAKRECNGVTVQKLIGFPDFSRCDWYDLHQPKRKKTISRLARECSKLFCQSTLKG